jgi:hypothetical protein
MLIEPVLKRHAEHWPSVEVRFGCRVERIEQDDREVRIHTKDGKFIGDYAVGCDGPKSLVREALGIRYEGIGAEDREFMGGRMLAAYLEAPAFYDLVPGRSWQYWAINRERSGIAVAIDGRGKFVFHSQLPRGARGTLEYAKESLALATGREFPYEILGIQEWTAGFMLVAERYRAGRVFLAGDAAHLFTPTAGQGYNTSAVCRGWGGEALLASYEAERKPIGHRNTAFARSIAKLIGELRLPARVEENSPVGEEKRAQFGKQLEELGWREFHAPGIYFGAFYGGSPVVAAEPGPPPLDDPHRYEPGAKPGARAPHVWLADGVALHDLFGRDFTLLKFADCLTKPIEKAFRARNVPLEVLRVDNEEARSLYARRLAIIRPDHHVAWRGDAPPQDAGALADRVTGKEMR